MKYLSVCSGIEAATVAWHHLGWEPVGFSEIEAFPAAILHHHYPDVPNFGDMTDFKTWNLDESAISLLVGGTPCQPFSVAGLRKGLSDDRGNLSLTFCEMADHYSPDFVLWENVPGVLSSKDNAFGCFLGGLAREDEPLVAPGGKWKNAGFVLGPKRAVAWRVLDAQYFGVAQRRRRVFVVGCPRNGTDPRQILFESEGVRRDTPPSREAGERVAPAVSTGAPFSRTGNERVEADAMVPVAQPASVAIGCDEELNASTEQSGTLLRGGQGGRHDGVMTPAMQVRRLTPVECERLQGFPDNYTLIPWRSLQAYAKKKQPGRSFEEWLIKTTGHGLREPTTQDCPDGPRYKALGNSMAVPVMRWIGERIARASTHKQEDA